MHKDEGDLMGKMFEVEITSAGKHFLVGRVLNDCDVSSPGLVEPLPKGAVSGFKPNSTQRQTDKNMESSHIWLRFTFLVLFVAILIRVSYLGYIWIKR